MTNAQLFKNGDEISLDTRFPGERSSPEFCGQLLGEDLNVILSRLKDNKHIDKKTAATKVEKMRLVARGLRSFHVPKFSLIYKYPRNYEYYGGHRCVGTSNVDEVIAAMEQMFSGISVSESLSVDSISMGITESDVEQLGSEVIPTVKVTPITDLNKKVPVSFLFNVNGTPLRVGGVRY